RYSATCLRRVWEAQRFSWGVTQLFHLDPTPNAFDRKRPLAELDYVTRSGAALRSLAENYAGVAGGMLAGGGRVQGLGGGAGGCRCWWSERAWSGCRLPARRRLPGMTWWSRKPPPASAPGYLPATARSFTPVFIIRPDHGVPITVRADGACSMNSAPRTACHTANAASLSSPPTRAKSSDWQQYTSRR